MSIEEGKNVWLFPDGELPVPNEGSNVEAHEALIMLNTSSKDANIKLSFYFEDKDPIENVLMVVEAKRVKCIRIDHSDEIGGVEIPKSIQYSLRVESDVKITATFGRLDTSSEKMAFYTSAWHSY